MIDPKTIQILPAITGDARRDALFRYVGGVVGGAIVGVAVGFAKAHGWWTPDADMIPLLTQAVGGLVIVWFVTRAGMNAVTKSEAAVVSNTISAATTGVVPAAIAARATPAQTASIDASPTAVVAPVPLTKA